VSTFLITFIKTTNNNMATKTLTNKQALTKMINSLDPIQLGILRERILAMTENILENEQEIRKVMEADNRRSLIHPDYYFQTLEAIRITIEY
jgi:hypothetical protein